VNMKKIFITLSIIGFIAGCAMTYEKPMTIEKTISSENTFGKTHALEKAKRVLLLNGFQIQSYDDNSGIISSSYKDVRLSPDDADCGTTMGLDYLKDNRTSTQFAINILVDNKSIIIKSMIRGEYKPGGGSAVQNITLSCKSKGILENKLLKQIVE